jgi:nitrite reductase (NO-forming)
MLRRIGPIASIGLLTVLLLAACGGSSKKEATATRVPATIPAGGPGTSAAGTAAASPKASPRAGTPAASPGAKASPAARTASPAASAAASTSPTVDMVDINFQQKAITIPANTEVTVTLVNKGAIAHNFNIDELNVHSGDVQPGQTKTVTINAKPGQYQYYCNVPGHRQAGMVGTLTVQ